MGAVPIGFPSSSLQLSTTPGDVLYTCPPGTHAHLGKLSGLDTSDSGSTVTYHLVRSGGSIAANNQIVKAAPIPRTTTAPTGIEHYVPEGLVLNPGDFIQGFAANASRITPMGSVTEYF